MLRSLQSSNTDRHRCSVDRPLTRTSQSGSIASFDQRVAKITDSLLLYGASLRLVVHACALQLAVMLHARVEIDLAA